MGSQHVETAFGQLHLVPPLQQPSCLCRANLSQPSTAQSHTSPDPPPPNHWQSHAPRAEEVSRGQQGSEALTALHAAAHPLAIAVDAVVLVVAALQSTVRGQG